MLDLAAVLLLAAAGATAPKPAPVVSRAEQALPTLAAAERAFAADASATSVREAFVAHLAEEAWIPRPQPVRAKAWFDAHPAKPGASLKWGPEYAEIAASADFGFTTGPSRFEADGNVGWGHFVSVWKRGADNDWKNVADFGIGHGEVPLEPALVLHAPSTASAERLDADALKQRRAALEQLDDALDGADGAQALAAASAADLRRFRDGSVPGPLPAGAASVAPGLKRVALELAASGDLAYTLGGRADGKADAQGSYLRLWRHGRDGWKLVVDVLNPPD